MRCLTVPIERFQTIDELAQGRYAPKRMARSGIAPFY